MSSTERSKGKRGERELTKALPGAIKISADYQPGSDVMWKSRLVEVKRRKTNRGFSMPDVLLTGAPIVALRADRGEWVISMRPDTLLDLIAEAEAL